MYKQKYNKYKRKYIRLKLGKVLAKRALSREAPILDIPKEIHDMMPNVSYDLLLLISDLEVGYINYHCEHADNPVFDCGMFIDDIIKMSKKIIKNKFTKNDKLFQNIIYGLVNFMVPPYDDTQKAEYTRTLYKDLINEIKKLYKKYKTETKFVKQFKKILNSFFDYEYKILKKYNLIEE